jgi:Gas vesicle synthesis protein GvpL/GvpF
MLLYCMTESDTSGNVSSPGVHEVQVESLAEGGVRCFYSRIERLAASSESLRGDALRFHAVLREILGYATVLPFRFPTLLETERELREFLASRAPACLKDFCRLRGMVQMEIRIRPHPVLSFPGSGREYMQARVAEAHALNAHAGAAFAAARELIEEWKVRHEPNGLHCYALVSREQVPAFEERIRSLAPVHGACIIVSGPWPVSEFLHVQNA